MTIWIWTGFLALIVFVRLLDLGVFDKKPHVIKLPEAVAWTTVWVALALLFNLFVFFLYGQNWLGWTDVHRHQLAGQQAAIQFLTGYLVEKSLSIDNLIVLAMIFAITSDPFQVISSTLVLIGAAMLVLPGPGLVIVMGCGILAIEFAWAKRWLCRVRATMDRLQHQITGR